MPPLASPARPRPEPLPPRVTPEEDAAHQAFVAKLGETAIWRTPTADSPPAIVLPVQVAEAVKPAPQFDGAIEAPFIVGLVTLHERMLIVMNIETLMGHSGLAVLPKMV